MLYVFTFGSFQQEGDLKKKKLHGSVQKQENVWKFIPAEWLLGSTRVMFNNLPKVCLSGEIDKSAILHLT